MFSFFRNGDILYSFDQRINLISVCVCTRIEPKRRTARYGNFIYICLYNINVEIFTTN